ncbi:MAG: 1,4-alpha-glucan branching enzyme [Candidatus Latescibacterota bacterium]|jgi:1,4-alpha-glucan branching enzyme
MSQQSKKRVYFRFQASDAKEVNVLGSFNGWEQRPLKKQKDGEWSTWTNLESGSYEYRFLVDGQWQDVPDAEKVCNPYGTENNLVTV